MPRMLIISSCIVNYNDDRGGVVHEVGEFVSVPKDTGLQLARLGRALYERREEDPSKSGVHTASPKMLRAAAGAARTAADSKPADDSGAQ